MCACTHKYQINHKTIVQFKWIQNAISLQHCHRHTSRKYNKTEHTHIYTRTASSLHPKPIIIEHVCARVWNETIFLMIKIQCFLVRIVIGCLNLSIFIYMYFSLFSVWVNCVVLCLKVWTIEIASASITTLCSDKLLFTENYSVAVCIFYFMAYS